MPALAGVAAALMLNTGASVATSDLVEVANRLRAECSAAEGERPPLVPSSALEEALREVADGTALEDAVAGTGYRARQLALLRVRTDAGPDAVGDVLASRYCDTLSVPELVHIGAHRRSGETLLIVAEPLATRELRADAAAVDELLSRINEARALPRRCGNTEAPAAPALSASPQLREAARRHAEDLAARGVLSHQGSDGSRPADRVGRAGYVWSAVAENVAAGQADPAAALGSWLDSPGHCLNLMNGRYTQTGIAVALGDPEAGGIFWVQVFAAPR